MRSLCLVIAIGLVALVGAEQALACSCAAVPTRDALDRADAAVIATLKNVVITEQIEPGGPVPVGLRARFKYRVNGVIKGAAGLDRGDSLTLRSVTSEASCGLPAKEGKRYGLLLDRRRKRLTANLCTVVPPNKLRRAAEGTAKGRICVSR